ncbi:MAG TPA: sigma 54-interacting transcriptional regulator [Vicinamibacterales bacterium]|nr:sigma 54-interacting transcriptional regulator [Vicinamibacterales bacterium]
MSETRIAVASNPQAARYEALIRLADAIRSGEKAGDLFALLVQELRHVVQFDAIAHFDETGTKVNWWSRKPHDGVCPLTGAEREESVAAWVHRQQEPLVVPYVDRETRCRPSMERLRHLGLQSMCALPLSTAHRKLGSLVVSSCRPDSYVEDDVRFLSLAAAQIALAMDDARNFRESQHVGERLRLLLDLTNRVVSTLDLRALLREVSASIRQVMHCDGAGVSLPDPESGQLRLYALDFPTSKGILHEGIVANVSQSLARVFANGQPVNLTREEIQADGPVALEGAQSLCRVPLVGRKQVLGVLSIGTHREHAFTDDDMTFLGQVATQIAIAVENALAYGEIADLKDKLTREKVYLEDEIRSELNFEEIVGTSDALRHVLRKIETVAATDSTVLIYGETGTGKELVARAVHNLSSRKAHAFVKMNCAAIPTGLLESELFGHEKGAFTGAVSQRTGRFELAHRGTMFLDEVSEIPLELQPKLLRVLQEREFERLGSARTLRTDARLIAATNRDLAEMVTEGTFRSDLYYRLNVFPVRLPPLRERPEDIPLLVRHFVQQFSRRNNRSIDTIPSAVMEALVQYHWPGNVRELQNVVERAVIISTGSVLKVPIADLKPAGRAGTPRRPAAAATLRASLGEAERSQILNALEASAWVIAGPNGAAARLGMKRSTLQFRMRKLGISVARVGRSG